MLGGIGTRLDVPYERIDDLQRLVGVRDDRIPAAALRDGNLARVHVTRTHAPHEVSVSDHPHERAVLDHGKRADVLGDHRARRVHGCRVVRGRRLRATLAALAAAAFSPGVKAANGRLRTTP